MNHWKSTLLARVCSGAMSAFRKAPLELSPLDLKHLRLSFSQFGEDLVIAEHLFGRRSAAPGIYVDAGCFDPFDLSNTRLLNLHGWKGINIDASSEVIDTFNKLRPGDHNVCAALAEKVEENEYLETCSAAGNRLATGAVPLLKSVSVIRRSPVLTRTLTDILRSSPWPAEKIDFLDIDCEGTDFAILKGLDLSLYRPYIICIEAHSEDEGLALKSYLEQREYGHLCRLGFSLLFLDKSTGPTPAL